ncbi:hypothetical protein J4Q44_G00271110 [Coregonus suidteri]|uniref:Uncharacterized protein n=1 Tax=Coregonus suidteri TaxID=861788 RepID=A0AAN8LE88_9TELE
MKDKLQLESDFMNQINTAQREAHETFSKTFNELKRFQEAISEAAVSHSEEVFRKKHQDTLDLHEENKVYELEIDYSKKIYEGEQAVKQLQKNRKRMLQKISVNEDQIAEAKEELSQMATLHANTKVNLEELEQKTFMVEQRMRKVTENLKKDERDESPGHSEG